MVAIGNEDMFGGATYSPVGAATILDRAGENA